MAKNASAKPSAGGASMPASRLKSSSLLDDTRVVYGGDNLEPFAKLPDACISALRTPPPAFALADSFHYHCDWHASHHVKVLPDRISGENNFESGTASKAHCSFSAGGQFPWLQSQSLQASVRRERRLKPGRFKDGIFTQEHGQSHA
jgi:hypothetical protein